LKREAASGRSRIASSAPGLPDYQVIGKSGVAHRFSFGQPHTRLDVALCAAWGIGARRILER